MFNIYLNSGSKDWLDVLGILGQIIVPIVVLLISIRYTNFRNEVLDKQFNEQLKYQREQWFNDIFIKKIQEDLVKFYDLLSTIIKDDYISCDLSNLINNEFDYEKIDYHTFFRNKLKKAEELEEQFIMVKTFLERVLEIDEEKRVKLFVLINTSKIIYSYMVKIQDALTLNDGPDIYDFFLMEYDKESNEEEIIGLNEQTQEELKNIFKAHCMSANLTLSVDGQEILKTFEEDIYYYRVCLSEICEELLNLKKIISDYMWKEV